MCYMPIFFNNLTNYLYFYNKNCVQFLIYLCICIDYILVIIIKEKTKTFVKTEKQHIINSFNWKSNNRSTKEKRSEKDPFPSYKFSFFLSFFFSFDLHVANPKVIFFPIF